MNFTQWKQDLQSAKLKGVGIKTTLVTPQGEIAEHTPFGKVEVLQTRQFAFNKEGRLRWVEFGPAVLWSFGYCQARKNMEDGSVLIIEFNSKETHI